jgi:hypothetical protein
MSGCYCAVTALQTAVAEVLESLGLEADPADVQARPSQARSSREQLERVALSSAVLAEVRRRLPVSEDDRRLIYRLVDAASRRLEDSRQPPVAAPGDATDEDVCAYAAAGGGCLGTFASFVAARRGIPAMPPAADPRRPPPGPRAPRSPMPTTTDPSVPTKTVRSSRWTGGRKAVRL